MSGNQEAMDGFAQVNSGVTSPAEFFSPENVEKIMLGGKRDGLRTPSALRALRACVIATLTAATARAHDATLCMRNIDDLCGLEGLVAIAVV